MILAGTSAAHRSALAAHSMVPAERPRLVEDSGQLVAPVRERFTPFKADEQATVAILVRDRLRPSLEPSSLHFWAWDLPSALLSSTTASTAELMSTNWASLLFWS